jgi:hypothetical protein
MKHWLCRTSIGLNILIIAVELGAWFNKDILVHGFLQQLYDVRVDFFFESYPLQSEDIVMLGDSIKQGGEWIELFPALPIRNRGISGARRLAAR